jgi:F-type H+-transporting ATPase subunit a
MFFMTFSSLSAHSSAYSILLYSAGEVWTTVPLLSLHWPAFSLSFWVSAWTASAVFVILAICASHGMNHSFASAGSTAISSLRLSIANFWSGQILERVHMKWRGVYGRSLTPNSSLSNRLVSAFFSSSQKMRKTTLSWIVVLFFVLLFCNAFGLIPLFSAVTGQAGYTLSLSIAFWIVVVYVGIERLSIRFPKLFLPSGLPAAMSPIFIALESLSYSFRAISLGVRLWANMFAGHQLLHLFTALSLVPALCCPLWLSAPLTVLAGCLLMALSGLETVVAILQSGVFCLLASFYLMEGLSKHDVLAPSLPSLYVSSSL